jgi:hypothetical protein
MATIPGDVWIYHSSDVPIASDPKIGDISVPKSSETSRKHTSGAAQIDAAINLDAAVPVKFLAPRQELIEVNDAAFTTQSAADCRLTHLHATLR